MTKIDPKLVKSKYRVKKSTNIWTDDFVYYPEEKWCFLWWRIGDNYPIFFHTEKDAWRFIELNYERD